MNGAREGTRRKKHESATTLPHDSPAFFAHSKKKYKGPSRYDGETWASLHKVLPGLLRVLLFFKRIVRILCFRDYKALRFRDICWCSDWPITSFVNLTWVKSEAQPSFILGGSYHHTFNEELLYQPTADFAEILFISQNGCKLWMAVVVHLANNSPLPSLASWYISGCTLRDLFTFRRLLQALYWFY